MCPGSHVGSVAKLVTVKPGLEGFISDLFCSSSLKTSSERSRTLTDSGIWGFQGFDIL